MCKTCIRTCLILHVLSKFPTGRPVSAWAEEPWHPQAPQVTPQHPQCRGEQKGWVCVNWRDCNLKDTGCGFVPKGLCKVTSFLHVSALQPQKKLFLLSVSQQDFQAPSISPGNTRKGDIVAPTRCQVCAGWFYPPLHLQEGRRTGTAQSDTPWALGAMELSWCQNTPHSSTIGPADGWRYRNRLYYHKNFLREQAKPTISYSHSSCDFIHCNCVLWHKSVLLLEETEHHSQQTTCLHWLKTIQCIYWFSCTARWSMWHIWLKKHVLWQNSDMFVTEVGLSVCVGCTMLGIARDVCTGQMLPEGTQCHPVVNVLWGVTPGDKVGEAGLAPATAPARGWSYGRTHSHVMENKWGGFICHIMVGYEKQNKGKNFIVLRNIPVSLETKYILSSMTIKQMPGKYHKQSIPSSGLLRKATLTGLDRSQYTECLGAP